MVSENTPPNRGAMDLEGLQQCPVPGCNGILQEYHHYNATGGIVSYGLACGGFEVKQGKCGLRIEHPVPSQAQAIAKRSHQPQAVTTEAGSPTCTECSGTGSIFIDDTQAFHKCGECKGTGKLPSPPPSRNHGGGGISATQDHRRSKTL